ncbi:ATP-binding cassette domain-containing protein, partial [Cereibacter changlensis]
AGLWAPSAGEIRLGGATLDQYDPDVLGGMIGYLPQRVALFDGTLAENIARLAADADPAAIVAAAQKAGAHEMILRLADGYDTQVSALGGKLSGGQVQRVGLARALYGDPVFLVMDEPNSNLDSEGTLALNAAIRGIKERGGVVFIMAHRPAAIQECDTLLMLEDGARRAFGPRDAVLREMVQNHTSLVGAKGAA